MVSDILRRHGMMLPNVIAIALLDVGLQAASEYTEEGISNMKVEQNIFEEEYYRNILRTIRDIATECKPDEIIAFIKKNCDTLDCTSKYVTLSRYDFKKEAWDSLLGKLNIDSDDNIKEIDVNLLVEEMRK